MKVINYSTDEELLICGIYRSKKYQFQVSREKSISPEYITFTCLTCSVSYLYITTLLIANVITIRKVMISCDSNYPSIHNSSTTRLAIKTARCINIVVNVNYMRQFIGLN